MGNGKGVQEERTAWTVGTRWETAWDGKYVWEWQVGRVEEDRARKLAWAGL